MAWKWGLRLTSVITLLVVWEALGRGLPGLLMPTASETLVALVRLLGGPELWRAMWISNQALLVGYLAALLVGVPVGLAIGRWRQVERPLDLYLNLLLVTPVSALIPILIMALGLGLAARAAVVFVFAVAIVAVNTRAGLRDIDPNLIEMARSFGASETQLWRKVLLPGARPAVLAGARLGLARAISGMVAVELLLVSVGFGRLLLRYQGDFDAGAVYAVVLVVAAQAVLLTGWLRRWERRDEAPGLE
jgi:NitT/TauT family transport system permease protein